MNSAVLRKRGEHFISLFGDRLYYRRLFHLAYPIALQNLIANGLNMITTVMIGQMGDVPVAAVALANQIFFLLTLLLFGITTGAAMFTAQLWGRGDTPNIRRVLGLSLILGMIGSLFFLLVAEVFPEAAIGIYSQDPQVIAQGSAYLRIFGWCFPFFAITFSYSVILRSTGEVKLPMTITITALCLNTLLGYGLIFGKLGLPAMGMLGAAVAILISRIFETTALLVITYRSRLPAAASLAEMFRLDLPFASRVLKPVLPVVVNEILWSTGISAYSVIFARIGTDTIAAINIASTIDQVAMVFFSGIGNACAILVGKLIGEGDLKEAQRYAGRSWVIGLVGAALVGLLVIFTSQWILPLYKVSPRVIDHAQKIILIMGLLYWLRMTNTVMFIGILRSGGDTHFAFILDAVIIWVLGVPLTAFAAFVLHLPVQLVYLMIYSEELLKAILAMYRFLSRKWVHNLAERIEGF